MTLRSGSLVVALRADALLCLEVGLLEPTSDGSRTRSALSDRRWRH